MTRILNFIVRNGKSDPSRSDGYRVDIGCGGSAYEKKAGGNTWRPVQTYGLDELSNDPDFGVFKFSLVELVIVYVNFREGSAR